jgi:hypothetical protein
MYVARPLGTKTEGDDMVYQGHVENGLIRLEDAVVLPEGASVRVEVAAAEKEEQFDPNAPPIEDVARAIFADVPKEEWDRLPADLTDRLDEYLYGTPE